MVRKGDGKQEKCWKTHENALKKEKEAEVIHEKKLTWVRKRQKLDTQSSDRNL
jgi:hypothetical protein